MKIDTWNIVIEDHEPNSSLVLIAFTDEISTYRARFDLGKKMFIDPTPTEVDQLRREMLSDEIHEMRMKQNIETALVNELKSRLVRQNNMGITLGSMHDNDLRELIQVMSSHRIANSLDALRKLAEKSRELGDIADALTQLSLYVKKI